MDNVKKGKNEWEAAFAAFWWYSVQMRNESKAGFLTTYIKWVVCKILSLVYKKKKKKTLNPQLTALGYFWKL